MERQDRDFRKKRLLSKFDPIQSEEEDITQYYNTIVPHLSENSTIAPEILQFDYSFGYNCKKLSNLCLIDKNILVFASGNLIHFLNIAKVTVTVRRSEGGFGIGSIAVNPKYNFLTVGENGQNPAIYLYEYPRMTIVSKLVGGGKATISSLAYSNNGEMLASQSGLPDLLLTIWNWREEKIILQQKSSSNLVYNLQFSTINDMSLITCGAEHIKFWKMCRTFTGLKLKGQLGRFGKTTVCDIYGILAIEEDKILSGCGWGNILVWEKGRIQYEVCRKNRRPCHSAPITQMLWQSGEVLTISLDGYVKVWYWDTVESSSPCSEDEAFIEIEPLYEYFIGNANHTSELISLVKRNPSDTTDYMWLAQDGNGGIWLCDISPEPFPQPPVQLFRCHAGEIVAISASPTTNHIATLGKDGRLHIYNYENHQLILQHQFQSQGRNMLWLPLECDLSGSIVVSAFEDGALRMASVNIAAKSIHLFQAIKAHREAIKSLILNPTVNILASGSEDQTVFIHKLTKSSNLVFVEPIGLIRMPSEVDALTWNPSHPKRLLIGCREGEIIHATLPEKPTFFTENTFFMSNVDSQELQCLPMKKEVQRMKRITEVWYKKAIMKEFVPTYAPKIHIIHTPSEHDSQEFTASFQREEEEQEVSEADPGQILWMKFTQDDTIWVAMSGDESGYVYEYRFGEEFNPVKCITIPEAEDLEFTSYLYRDDFLAFGMSNGMIRLTRIQEDFRLFNDYWQLVMHDNKKGIIPRLINSRDGKYLFSIGHDGNVFSYRWNCPQIPTKYPAESEENSFPADLEEIQDRDFSSTLSLEEEKQKISDELRNRESQIKKQKVRDILAEYREEFRDIVERNSQLPEEQRIGDSDELQIDERINRDLQNSLEKEMNLLKRKMAFDVEKAKLASTKMMHYFIDPLETYPIEVTGLNTTKSVKSFRVQKLNEEYFACKSDLERRILLDVDKITTKEQRLSIELNKNLSYSHRPTVPEGEGVKMNRIESFLKDLTETKSTFNLHMKMRRLLNKYQERKSREMERKREWESVNAQKPNISVNHPDDEKALIDAKATIGDYKLKTDLKHLKTEDGHNMLLDKYNEILKVREEIFMKKNEYNEKIFSLRQRKADLVASIGRQFQKLTDIHREIPEGERKFLPTYAEINEKIEYPEISLKLVNQDDILGISRQDSSRKRSQEVSAKHDFDIDALEREILYHTKDGEETAWEIELRHARMTRKLFEQNQLTEEIGERIKDFDDNLIQLDHERLSVELDVKFLEIHLLTLNEELEILRDFEDKEANLVENVDAMMLENSQLLGTIMSHETKLDTLKKNLHKLREEEKTFAGKFQENCSESRFYRIFKGIFEGKHGSVDFPTAAASLGSIEFGSQECSFRYDDEAIDEYDRELYHFVLQLRRQMLGNAEAQTVEQQKIAETKKTLEKLTETIKNVQKDLAEKQENLLKSRREKQKLLNDIKTVVILRMDQLQYFRERKDFECVEKTLLFTNENVAKLYARVGQLAVETVEAKRKHRVNIVHLSRLKTDCHCMESEIAQLKMEIKTAMMKKFGMTVNLDELQEAVLRRLVYEIRLNIDSIAEDFDRKTAEQKRLLSEKKIEYIRVIREGTDKLNILTVLQEEQNFLSELLAHQEKIRENRKTKRQIDFSKDLDRLREISKQQKAQIESLQREIRTLSLKCKPFGALGPEILVTPRDRLAQFEQKEYEDSIFASVMDSLPNSDRGGSPDFLLSMEIGNIVAAFLQRSLGKRFGEKHVKRCCDNLTKYFLNVAKNFDFTKSEELLPCIVQDFQAYLPDECRWSVCAADIANVFERIITKFRTVENDVDFKDVISGIVENSVEIVTVTGAESYTDALITEIFRQICVTLQLTDFTDKSHINLLVDAVATIADLNLQEINMEQIGRDVEEFATTNLTDDIDSNFIKSLIGSFVEKLQSKLA